MPQFRYLAVNLMGKKQKGIIDAINLHDAKERLRNQGTIILKLSVIKLSIFDPKIYFNLRKRTLKGDTLVNFTNQLCELMKAKIPLYESLISLEEMYRGEPFHHIVHTLVESIKKGGTLSAAMEKFPDAFSSLYVAMIRAGEAIGALDKTLIKLAELISKQNQLKKNLRLL